jgi:hypothetical protein
MRQWGGDGAGRSRHAGDGGKPRQSTRVSESAGEDAAAARQRQVRRWRRSDGGRGRRPQREKRGEMDGPPVCDRKRDERVKEEKLTWPLAPHGWVTWLKTGVDSVYGSNLHGFVSLRVQDAWFRSSGFKIG